MTERISLELTSDYAIVKSQKYIMVEGIEHKLGDMFYRLFVNSEQGRIKLNEAYAAGDLSQADYDAILAKWGSVTTVIEQESDYGEG